MKLNDEMLYENAAAARDLWLSTFPNTKEDVPEHPFSRQFEKKMNRLLKQQRRSPRMNTILKYSQRVAIFILVLFGVTFAGLMTVEACRTAIIHTITQVFKEYTYFQYSVNESEGEAMFEEAILNYLPLGMEQVEAEKYDTGYWISYEDADGNYLALEATLIDENTDYQLFIDTEDAEVEHFAVLGEGATLSHKKDWTIIVWTHRYTAYTLRGNTSAEEGKKIVENITYQQYQKN